MKTLGASIQSLEKISTFVDYNTSLKEPKARTRPLSLQTQHPQTTRRDTSASLFDIYRMVSKDANSPDDTPTNQ